MTFPEMLDAAESGEEFGALLGGFFDAIQVLKEQEEADES